MLPNLVNMGLNPKQSEKLLAIAKTMLELAKAPYVSDIYAESPGVLSDHQRIKEGSFKGTKRINDTNVHTSFSRDGDHIHYITHNDKPNGKPISYVKVNPTGTDDMKGPYVSIAHTHEDHRNQGLRSTLQDHLKNYYPKIHSDNRMTPGENKVWERTATDYKEPVHEGDEHDEDKETIQHSVEKSDLAMKSELAKSEQDAKDRTKHRRRYLNSIRGRKAKRAALDQIPTTPEQHQANRETIKRIAEEMAAKKKAE